MFMITVRKKNGDSYDAKFLTVGREAWEASTMEPGVSFYCADTMCWIPLKEIAEIQLGGIIFIPKES